METFVDRGAAKNPFSLRENLKFEIFVQSHRLLFKISYPNTTYQLHFVLKSLLWSPEIDSTDWSLPREKHWFSWKNYFFSDEKNTLIQNVDYLTGEPKN